MTGKLINMPNSMTEKYEDDNTDALALVLFPAYCTGTEHFSQSITITNTNKITNIIKNDHAA